MPAERLLEERERMRPLLRLSDVDRRFVVRVAAAYLRLDRNDYSIDPRFAGRRIEARISPHQITAVAWDTASWSVATARSFAGG